MQQTGYAKTDYDTLLRIAAEVSADKWNEEIAATKSWPVLFNFSHIRENLLEGIPFTGEERVLEIGAGCGALTGALCRRAKKVDAVEASPESCLVNEKRNRDCDNLTIYTGEFSDIEGSLTDKYDVITIIGASDYDSSLLELATRHLSPDGFVVIAAANRYGMKYWAGCAEDNTGRFSDGLEGYCQGGAARTYGKAELENILSAAGFTDLTWKYPYPDYRLPLAIYTDAYLPKAGELRRNLTNYDMDRYLLFDEGQAWDGVIENGQFPFFANSYLIIARQKPAEEKVKMPDCSWMSNDRAKEYSIVTSYYKDTNTVVKKAANEAAKEHIKAIADNEAKLSEVYAGTALCFADCTLSDDGGSVSIPYMEGTPLSKVLGAMIDDGNADGAKELLLHFMSTITGDAEADAVLSYTDIDIIPQNVLYADGKFVVYDYEWAFENELPAGFMRWRILNYTIRTAKEIVAFGEDIYESLGITAEKKREYAAIEAKFQKSVGAGRKSLSELYADIHGKAVSLPDMEGIMAEYEAELSRQKELEKLLLDKNKLSLRLIKLSKQPITMYDGRDYEKVYDYLYYLANNRDVLEAFKGDIQQTLRHFVEFGMKEGRQGSAAFNPKRYRLEHSQLRQKYGDDYAMYYRQYMKETR